MLFVFVSIPHLSSFDCFQVLLVSNLEPIRILSDRRDSMKCGMKTTSTNIETGIGPSTCPCDRPRVRGERNRLVVKDERRLSVKQICSPSGRNLKHASATGSVCNN